MLSTQPARELLEGALESNTALESAALATREGIVLMHAGAAANVKMYALLAAQAYESAGAGLEVGEKRVYVTAKEEYLFIVVGPAALPWGAFVPN